jgi:hypothetical protein
VAGHGVRAAAAALPLALWLGGIGWLARGDRQVAATAIAFQVALWGAAVLFVASRSRTPLSPKGLEVRRNFEAARRYFARELRRPRPALRDEWIPYILALGLGRGMDRWVRVHGGVVAGLTPASGAGVDSVPAWSGGGGAFSGGGASGTWAALGSISSAVPAPGSSGGSGSSGSSSGGGGGGGW